MPLDERQLVEHFRDRILYFALRRVRDRAAAEELAQEVLLAVIEAAREEKIRDESNIGGFVFGVANNKVKKWLQKRGRQAQTHTELTRETEGRALDNPEASFLVREQRQTVRKALEQLSPGDQEVLIRCHQEPNSLETIAEEMGVSYAALRKRKSRALERLRNAMEGVTKPT